MRCTKKKKIIFNAALKMFFSLIYVNPCGQTTLQQPLLPADNPPTTTTTNHGAPLCAESIRSFSSTGVLLGNHHRHIFWEVLRGWQQL